MGRGGRRGEIAKKKGGVNCGLFVVRREGCEKRGVKVELSEGGRWQVVDH
jgi:hypothetical protein